PELMTSTEPPEAAMAGMLPGGGKLAGAGRPGRPSVGPMVPLSHVLTFAAVVSVLIAIPGPSVLFTISRALTVGRRAALLSVVGLPEFSTSAPGHLPVPAQMLILGALFPVIALVLDSAWAAIAGTARQWLVRSPRRMAMIGGTGGLMMIGLGISVAVTGRKD